MKENTLELLYRRPSVAEIKAHAYQIYVQRGCQPGHDLDDWLQSEYELTRLPIRKIAELEPPLLAKIQPRAKTLVNLVHNMML